MANASQGDEVLHLPKIVEAAESSPGAAATAVYQIRKALDKNNFDKAFKQYNGMMLLRILVDNPGTCKYVAKNFDTKFQDALKSMLRLNRDPSVQHITRETLDHFKQDFSSNEDLKPLLQMWEKEKASNPAATSSFGSGLSAQQAHSYGPGQRSLAPQHSNGRPRHSLPDPSELAGRIEEARTSAKLLIQLVQSTPSNEFNGNELIKEFADRCQTAQRNLHGYMNATDPGPDEQTFQTLIETCEQLSLASSKHQRAALAARKQTSQALDRADQLYNDEKRETAMNGTTSPPTLPPARTSQPEQLVPISRHAAPTPEAPVGDKTRSVESSDPFADSNQVPQTIPAGQQLQPQPAKSRVYGNKRSPPQAQSAFAELPTASTPPPTQHSHNMSDSGDFGPPSGPPPSRRPAPPVPTSNLTDDHSYGALGRLEHERPRTSDSNDLYSADHPTQYANTNGASSKPAWGEAETPQKSDFSNRGTMLGPPTGTSKVKDDEPLSPVGGVPGSGWGY